MTDKTGGPAFPSNKKKYIYNGPGKSPSEICYRNVGVNIRDYMAGQALLGLLLTKDPQELRQLANIGLNIGDLIAHESYDLADAMLRARGE